MKIHGLVPELLNPSLTVNIFSMRAIFYLVIIDWLSNKDSYLNYTLLSQQQLKHYYFNQNHYYWGTIS